MAYIIVPSRRVLTRQPDASARITDSTLAESLLTAWLPHTSPMIDIVTGAPLDDPYAGASFTGLACDAEGEISRGNNNSTLYRSLGRFSRVSYDGWSQLLVVRPLAAITAARNISYLVGASAWNSSEIWVGRDGVSQFSYRAVGGASLSVNAGPYTVGKRYVLVGVSRPTGTEFWINGKLVGTTTSVYGNQGYSRNLALYSADVTANRMRYIGGAAWARALRQSEAAALSENPWQIFRPRRRVTFFDLGAGGATAVNNDLAASYLIRAAASADVEADYILRAAASADTSPGYTIRAAVAAELAAAYSVTGSVAADSAASYNIHAAVAADSAAAYNLRAAVQSDLASAYTVRESVSADLAGAYDIQTAGSVASSSTTEYAIRGAVSSDLPAAYNLHAAVAADSQALYALRAAVSADSSASYDIEAGVASVYADLFASYAVDGIAIADPPARYTITAAARAREVVASARSYQVTK